MNYLLKNGQLLVDERLQAQDVLVVDGKIAAIGADLEATTATVIDLHGDFISPGLVDLHVHLRDPGQTYKETIKTGSQAAAHGGFTFVGAMPNLTPVPDNAAQIQKMVVRNQAEAVIRIGQYATITEQRTAGKLVDFPALKAAGAFAFSNDGSGIQDADTMYQAMRAAKAVNLPLAAHVEDDSLLHGGVMNAGAKADELGLPGISNVVETAQLARDLVLAQATGVHYHVCHVSTAESVQMIRLAKQAGVQVTCEVTPHHLLLSDRDIPADQGNYKMNPPLRSEHDRQALIAGLIDGTIDCIATDHAPHGTDEKQQSMRQAPFGIVGSETAFSLLFTNFVKTRIFTLAQLINWLSYRPAQLFNLPTSGQLKSGQPADLAIFDLKHRYQITADSLYSKGKNTPFIDNQVYGETVYTLVAGQIVYQRGGTTK
ncbi:dihydroorotase [Loigolactobacillus zhaoyuanensis]|uniref:Dihydroorotase n=1 Tax=Loigolactobacillus zhaoyuanensis TaxID=2486017 RepID=A0ABW8UB79_9LACO|nr:dihydroorotase [Loigolactobacillus zhaoyuanensis]